jgi:hypothetical protein
VFVTDIELQVEGNTGSPPALSNRTIGFSAYEINKNGEELDLPDQVGQYQTRKKKRRQAADEK